MIFIWISKLITRVWLLVNPRYRHKLNLKIVNFVSVGMYIKRSINKQFDFNVLLKVPTRLHTVLRSKVCRVYKVSLFEPKDILQIIPINVWLFLDLTNTVFAVAYDKNTAIELINKYNA